MRSHLLLAAAAALAVASPARAQLSNRSISLESGISLPSGELARASIPVALAATAWLEGSVDALARLSFGAAAEPSGRVAARRVEGTAGLRWSHGTDALRPSVQLEMGWGRSGAPDGRVVTGLALAAGAGLEWFLARDTALAAHASVRRAPAEGWRLELTFGATRYF